MAAGRIPCYAGTRMCSPVADLGVGNQVLGSELVAEQGTAELVEPDLMLGDIAGRHQTVEDDPRLATIDQIVIVSAEHGASVPHRPGGGIRIGATDLAVRASVGWSSGWAGGIQTAVLAQIPPPRIGSHHRVRVGRGRVAEGSDHMGVDEVAEPGHQGIHGCMARNPGRVGQNHFPRTRPAAWHRSTTGSKKRRKTPSPRR
jgi:hypothetical protein